MKWRRVATVKKGLDPALAGLGRCCVSCVIRGTEQRHVELKFVFVKGDVLQRLLDVRVLKHERNRILLFPVF